MTLAIIVLGMLATFLVGYAIWIVATWRHYGHPGRSSLVAADLLLDRFMPDYDVVERHHATIDATPDAVFAAATEINLSQLPIVRAIVATRQLVLGADDDPAPRPAGLLAYTRSIGWGDLAFVPHREIVLGAITRPWEPNVEFRPLRPDVFRAFNEPGFVKIVWNLRADTRHDGGCDFWTETRSVATDAEAKRRFRWYWARFSAGIALIRWSMVRHLKRQIEHRPSAMRAA